MSLPIRFDAEAEEELEAAAVYYEERRIGLGRAFLQAVDDAVIRLREDPRQYGRPPAISAELDVRRVLLRRFPYSLVYIELPGELRVLAVAHGRKRPGYWSRRIANNG